METTTRDADIPVSEEMNKFHESPEAVKRRRIGFFLVAGGAFLCIFGFVITLFLLQHEANFNFALYGATGLGGTMLFGGLVALLA